MRRTYKNLVRKLRRNASQGLVSPSFFVVSVSRRLVSNRLFSSLTSRNRMPSHSRVLSSRWQSEPPVHVSKTDWHLALGLTLSHHASGFSRLTFPNGLASHPRLVLSHHQSDFPVSCRWTQSLLFCRLTLSHQTWDFPISFRKTTSSHSRPSRLTRSGIY